MEGPITYDIFSAAFAALSVGAGVWFFIERRFEARVAAVQSDIKDLELKMEAHRADAVLFRELIISKYVSTDQLTKLEERILEELREMRRFWERLLDDRRKQ